MPDPRFDGGVSYRTVWLAFREPPDLHQSGEREAEAVIVNDEEILRGIVIPGFRFVATVDGQTPSAEIEVLGPVGTA